MVYETALLRRTLCMCVMHVRVSVCVYEHVALLMCVRGKQVGTGVAGAEKRGIVPVSCRSRFERTQSAPSSPSLAGVAAVRLIFILELRSSVPAVPNSR